MQSATSGGSTCASSAHPLPSVRCTSARTARKTSAGRRGRARTASTPRRAAAAAARRTTETTRAGRCESTTTRSARRTASSTSWVTSSAAPRALLERALEPRLGVEAGLGVERGERLVERQHRALGHQRPHERHALAHAARERVRVVLGEPREPVPLEQREGGRARARAPGPRARVRAARCRARCATRAAGRAAASARPAPDRPVTSRPSASTRPERGSEHACRDREQRRLAAARRPDEGDGLVRRDRQIDAREHRHRWRDRRARCPRARARQGRRRPRAQRMARPR